MLNKFFLDANFNVKMLSNIQRPYSYDFLWDNRIVFEIEADSTANQFLSVDYGESSVDLPITPGQVNTIELNTDYWNYNGITLITPYKNGAAIIGKNISITFPDLVEYSGAISSTESNTDGSIKLGNNYAMAGSYYVTPETISQINNRVSDVEGHVGTVSNEIETLQEGKQNFIDQDILTPSSEGTEGDLIFKGTPGIGSKELYRYENDGWIKVEFDSGGSGGSGVNYSTSEQDTGLLWIDLNAIYQITYELNITLTPYTWVSTGISMNDIDILIDSEAISSDGVVKVDVKVNLGIIYVMGLEQNISPTLEYLTLRYTKGGYVAPSITKVFDCGSDRTALTHTIAESGLYLLINSGGAGINEVSIGTPQSRVSLLEDSLATQGNLPRWMKYKIVELEQGDDIIYSALNTSQWENFQRTIYKLEGIDINNSSTVVSSTLQADGSAVLPNSAHATNDLYFAFGVAGARNSLGNHRDDTIIGSVEPIAYIKGDKVGVNTVNGIYYDWGLNMPEVSMYGYDGGAAFVIGIKL